MREGEEPKAPRHASAAATRDGNLPSRDGSLLYITAIYLIPDTNRLLISIIKLVSTSNLTSTFIIISLRFIYS